MELDMAAGEQCGRERERERGERTNNGQVQFERLRQNYCPERTDRHRRLYLFLLSLFLLRFDRATFH